MVRRRSRRTGLYLLLLAVLFRILIWLGVEGLSRKVVNVLSSPQFTQLMLAVFTATEPPQSAATDPTVWVVHKLASREAAMLPAPTEQVSFTSADADAVTVAGACTYRVDKLSLLQTSTPLLKTDAPTVLIVHTHSSEAYTQTAGFTYAESDPLRTLTQEQSVVRVGAEMAEVLRERGISVVHDTSYNDYPDYNGAYTRTGGKIQKWLEQYPSISVVLDVHRDAVMNADGTPRRTVTTLQNGETAAQLMLVVGTDQGGTHHPNWQANLSWALKVQALLERENENLCRNLDLRTERFNQHYTAKSMLVEVGNTGNTLPEALAAARVFAGTLADLINASAQ